MPKPLSSLSYYWWPMKPGSVSTMLRHALHFFFFASSRSTPSRRRLSRLTLFEREEYLTSSSLACDSAGEAVSGAVSGAADPPHRRRESLTALVDARVHAVHIVNSWLLRPPPISRRDLLFLEVPLTNTRIPTLATSKLHFDFGDGNKRRPPALSVHAAVAMPVPVPIPVPIPVPMLVPMPVPP